MHRDDQKIETSLFTLKKAFKEMGVIRDAGGNKNENMVIQNLNQNFHLFNQQMTTTNKHLLTMSRNVIAANKPQQGSHLRKEDPNKKLLQKLGDIDSILVATYKFNKDQKEKKKTNWLGLFGAALAAGGLLGFLMTGKTEFLNNIWKGLAKYSPLKFVVKLFDKFLMFSGEHIVKGVPKLFGKIFDAISKMPIVEKGISKVAKLFKPITEIFEHMGGLFGKLGGGIGKNISKITGIFKPITEIFMHMGGLFGKLGGIFGKGVGKVLGKGLGKGVGKAFLKKIPIIGSIMGLIFGIQRFKKGDIFGGILEVASGIASIVPGAGTILGIAIDSFLIFRDMAGSMTIDKQILTKFVMPSIDSLRSVPVVGTIISAIEAFSKFKNDPSAAITDIIGIADSIIPGLGKPLNAAVGWVSSLANWAPIKNIMGNMGFGNKPVIGGKYLEAGKQILADRNNKQQAGGGNIAGVNKWSDLIDKYSTQEGVDPNLAKAIMAQESGGNPNATSRLTKYGTAKGLMQMIDPTASSMGVANSYDPEQNIMGGVKYLHQLSDTFGGDQAKIIAAYNAGPTAIKKYGGIPPYAGYDETRDYVPKVQAYYNKFANANNNLPSQGIPYKIDKNDNTLELTSSTIQELAKAIGTQFKGALPTGKSGNMTVSLTSPRG